MGCDFINEADIPDPNYNFFVKVESQQKDGLDIYRASKIIDYYTDLRCPLCKCKIPKEERDIIINIIYHKGINSLLSNIEQYNNQTERADVVDDINTLEEIYLKIEGYSKSVKENRLYKHTCKNNELCNRTNNQDVYIDLCSIDNLDDYFENNLKININKLKNDLDYKKEYLKKKN